MRGTVFGLVLLIAGATAASAQNKGHPAPTEEQSTFVPHEVCMMLPGIFSAYSLDERIAGCTAVIESGKYSGKELGEIYFNRSVFHIQKGEDDAALADIEMSHKLWPDFVRPLIDRATVYMRRHQPELALPDLNRVIDIDPDNYAALTNRASVYFTMGKLDPATNDLDRALEANSTGNTAWLLRGEIASMRGDYDSASKDYALSIRYDPDKPNAYNANCYALALIKREMETTALAACNKALEIEPGRANTLDSRGFLYLQLGRYADAIADYDAALAKDPQLAPSLYGRGLARQKSGDATGGAADITAAESMSPGIGAKFGTPAIYTWRRAPAR